MVPGKRDLERGALWPSFLSFRQARCKLSQQCIPVKTEQQGFQHLLLLLTILLQASDKPAYAFSALIAYLSKLFLQMLNQHIHIARIAEGICQFLDAPIALTQSFRVAERSISIQSSPQTACGNSHLMHRFWVLIA